MLTTAKLRNEDLEPNEKVRDDRLRGRTFHQDTRSHSFEPSYSRDHGADRHQWTPAIRYGARSRGFFWSKLEKKRLLMARAMSIPYQLIRDEWFPHRTVVALHSQWSLMTKELKDPQARVILVPKSRKALSVAQTRHSTETLSKPDHDEGSFGQQKRATGPRIIARTVHSLSNDTNAGTPSKPNIETLRETHQDLHSTGAEQSRDIPEDEAGFQPTVDDYSSDSASRINDDHLDGKVTPGPARNDGPEASPPPYTEGVQPQVASNGPEEPPCFRTGEPRVHEPEMPFSESGPGHRKDKTRSHFWDREMEDEIVNRLLNGMGREETLRAIRELGFGRTDRAIMSRIGELIVALGWQIKAVWSKKMQEQLLEAIDNGHNLLEIRNRLFPKLTIVELHRRLRQLRPVQRNSSYDNGKRDEVDDEEPTYMGKEPRNENSGKFAADDEDMSFTCVESGDDDSSDEDHCDGEFGDEDLSDDGGGSDDESPGNRYTGPQEDEQSHASTFPATQSPTFEQPRRSTVANPHPSTETADLQCHDTEQTHPKTPGGSIPEALEDGSSSDQEDEKVAPAPQSSSDFDKPSTEPTRMCGENSTARQPLQDLHSQARRPTRAASHEPEGTHTHSASLEAWAALGAGTATLGQEATSQAWNRVREAGPDSTGEESEEE